MSKEAPNSASIKGREGSEDVTSQLYSNSDYACLDKNKDEEDAFLAETDANSLIGSDIKSTHESATILSEKRKARKEAERKEKAEKQVYRETARLLKSRSCDHRIEVRLKATEAVHAAVVTSSAAGTAIKLDEFPVLTSISRSGSSSNSTSSSGSSSKISNSLSLGGSYSLSALDLREFSLSLLQNISQSDWAEITSLNLSHNELCELPGIDNLVSLTELDLSRNWFKDIPFSFQRLPLVKLNMSRNFIRPNTDFLKILLQPPGLPTLEDLDITFNKKCYTQDLADMLAEKLPNVTVRITVTFPPPPGAYVGSVSDRDPTLLRSQLEPYTTQALRKRLATTFGQKEEDYNDDENGSGGGGSELYLPRAEVMRRILDCYAKAGVTNERRKLRVNGTPVDSSLLEEILLELRAWSARNEVLQERPMINAQKYMIIRSPMEFEQKLQIGSAKASTAKKKYDLNSKLWNLASAALRSVDPEFASKFSGLAVTQGFRGSPHIDTTNTGPFYGLAIGDFADGTGGIQVEVDPFTIAEVNTKGRLGKVDGRFPHWVAPYDHEHCERFSLIFYHTEGEVCKQTTAIFGDEVKEEPQ